MTQMDLFQTATSSQPDTHANHFHKPGSEEAVKMTDISGRTYFPLFKENDRLGAFSRMFLGTSLWGSTKCYLTWKGKATPQGRSLFQLVPLTHITEETDFGSSVEMWRTPMAADGTHNHCLAPSVVEGKTTLTLTNQVKGGIAGLWTTPNTMDHLPQRSKEALERQANTTRKGRTRPANLREQVNPETVEAWEKAQEPQMWPTPRACSAMSAENIHNRVKDKFPNLESEVARSMWPTPSASDNRDRGHVGMPAIKRRMEKGKQLNLSMVVPEVSGSLNPEWVEWLMGYPRGWTDLKD